MQTCIFPTANEVNASTHLHDEIDQLVYGGQASDHVRGVLVERDKPLLFSMRAHGPALKILPVWSGGMENPTPCVSRPICW